MRLKDSNCPHIKDSLSKPNPWKDHSLECSGLRIKLDSIIVLFAIQDSFHSMPNTSPKQVLPLSGEELKIESKSSKSKILMLASTTSIMQDSKPIMNNKITRDVNAPNVNLTSESFSSMAHHHPSSDSVSTLRF